MQQAKRAVPLADLQAPTEDPDVVRAKAEALVRDIQEDLPADAPIEVRAAAVLEQIAGLPAIDPELAAYQTELERHV